MEDSNLRIRQIIADADKELKLIQVEKDIPLELDAGNLAVDDINSLDENALRNSQQRDASLIPIGRDSIQTLIGHLFQLEKTTVDNLPYIVLPPPKTILPREKPVPKPKPMTKWEKYAKDKGIVKKKKEHKLWDEVAQDFVPRYGKLKVQVEKDKNWVMEVPRQSDPFEDQFVKAKVAKKERIAKNEYQRLRNIARARKEGTPGVGVLRTDTRDIASLKKAMHFSLGATASLGKFQPRLPDEETITGFTKHARKDVDKPFAGGIREETSKAIRIVERINKPVVNTDSAIIKQVEKNLIIEQDAERRAINKTGRRSKLGGHKNKKSGQSIASLTDGQMGDKRSRKVHAANKAAAAGTAGGKGKRGKKNKSVFVGAPKKTVTKAGGKTKNVVMKRRR